MTAPLDSTDKKIVFFFLLVLILLTLLALLLSPAYEGPGFPSSYSASSGGAKAAYTLLAETGYRVDRWTNSPEELPSVPRNALLIIAGPSSLSSDQEATQLKRFVSGGGRLLITGMPGASMISAKGVESTLALPGEWQSFTAEAPAPLTRGAPEISLESPARWVHLEPGQVRYYGSADGAAVTKLPLGRGEIIWWASASPLTNYGITKASNLALFLNCVGSPGKTRILWDEYYHGARRGLLSYLSRTPLPWALLQVLVLAAFVVFTYARRSGAVRPLRRESRLSPLEFIETLGALYQRKGAAAGALEIAFARFRFLLARKLALPSLVTTEELIRRVSERPGWTSPEFAETLGRIDSALKIQQVSEPQALEWVGELYEFTRKLGLGDQGIGRSGDRKIGSSEDRVIE